MPNRLTRLCVLPFVLAFAGAQAAPILTMPLPVAAPPAPDQAPLVVRAARAIAQLVHDYGDACQARVWRQKENGSAGDLLMYRQGGERGAMVANIGHAPQTVTAMPDTVTEVLLSKDLTHDRLPDFVTVLALTPTAKPQEKRTVLLALELYSDGSCTHLGDGNCRRATGYLVNHGQPVLWQLAEPVPVVVEDSCAAARHGNFIDAKPFYKKVHLPN